MSIYSSLNSWGCSTTDQSPINLSQSSSKTCDLLCDLTIEDISIPQANVIVSDEGLVLQNTAGLGTCKYNGKTYTSNHLLVNHPSHHTLENVQADGEVMAIFTSQDGDNLCVSSLFRVGNGPSNEFFNKFVSFANTTTEYVPVNLGDGWNLTMMTPKGGYYVYSGSFVFPPCQASQWVVFKNMITIDANDFALLIKNNAPGSRPIQQLGTRDVYYNDKEGLTQGLDPTKKHMRCKRVGKPVKSTVKDVSAAPLKAVSSKLQKEFPTGVHKYVSDQLKQNGYLAMFDVVIMVLCIFLGGFYGWKASIDNPLLFIPRFGEKIGMFFRSLFTKTPQVFPISTDT